MEWIDYRQLPPASGGFSELFFDYVYDFDEVGRFYPPNFRDNHSYEALLKQIDARSIDRTTLVSVMLEQNRLFGVPAKALENIQLLERPTTYAVVTGQQVGIFGGPAYTVFKTITTIKLAQRLKLKFPHYDFVPVFWIEGEDHDFAEMNHISVFDSEAKPVNVQYLPGGEMPERNMGAVGELTFDASLDQSFATLEAALQKTEFTATLVNKLKEFYKTGATFNGAFASWMSHLFEDYGLTFLSVHDTRLKKLLSPLFVKEIEGYPKTSQTVIARSAELEQKYHAQIKAKSINLFLFHKDGRYGIEPREHDFSLKGTRHFLQEDELLKIAVETPELLSPNVVLRPIAQDTLLPTVAYVGGPSEIAYHGQLGPVYESFGVTPPILYPRASASFVEDRVARTIEKYQLELVSFFEDVEQVKARIVEQIEEVKVDKIFGDTTKLVHDALNEIRFGIKEIDPTLLGTLDGVKSKFDINLGVLKEKALAAQKRKNEVAMRQIEKAVTAFLPNGSLQEREISILHYMNKYGPELIRWLMGEMDITGFKHQILML